MHVLLATHASLEIDSGEERALQDLGQVLLARGHRVRFANYEGLLDNVRRRTSEQVRERLGTAELVSVPAMPLVGRLWAVPSLRGLRSLARSVGWSDVVVFGQFYGFDAVVYLLGRALGKPVVCSQANALFRRFRSDLRDAVQEAYERTVGVALLRRFAGVRVCNTDDLRELTRRGCRNVVLLYPPNMDLSAVTSPADLPPPFSTLVRKLSADPRFKVLVAGRMTHQKGLDLLEEALLCLGERRPQVVDQLVVLCAGTDRLPEELNRVARDYPGLVENLGILPREVFPSVLGTVNAVVMPSRYESFGRVAAEAQSLGRPVIGTNITGLREVVVPGVTGLLVDRWSGDALAEAIEQLRTTFASDPERWSGMGAASRKNFEEHLGVERVRAQLDALVDMLEGLAKPSPR